MPEDKRVRNCLETLWYMGNRHDRKIDVDSALAQIREVVLDMKKGHAIDMVVHETYHQDCSYCEWNSAIQAVLELFGGKVER